MSVAEIALDYHTNGFFPLPLKGKTLIRRGVSGSANKNLSRNSISKIENHNNLGLRLPVGVIGIDWDAYKGAEAFESLIELLGDLPATYRSTSRTDGKSGIYLYTVPASASFPGEILDCNVDIIKHTHRYATVFPSIHPDTAAQYNWYFGAPGKESFEIDIPSVKKLPALPERWAQFLSTMSQLRTGSSLISDFKSAEGSFSGRVSEFAKMTSGNRNNAMKDLARDGMWYELGGRLEDGQSFAMILDAAKSNGLVEDDGISTVEYRIVFSRTWAEKHFDASKVGVAEASNFDEANVIAWNNTVQASNLGPAVKTAANILASFAIEKQYGYVVMSQGALAEVMGCTPQIAGRHIRTLSERGWTVRVAGQGVNTEKKTLRANSMKFNFDMIVEGTAEATRFGDISDIIDAYSQKSSEKN